MDISGEDTQTLRLSSGVGKRLRLWSRLGEVHAVEVLLGLAALFMALGALSLHLAAPTAALSTLHLLALLVVWGGAWGGSYWVLRTYLPRADLLLLPLLALLTGWGLLLLARLAPGFLTRQLRWLLIGCAVMCGVALRSDLPRLLRRYRYTLLAAGMALLSATLFFGVNPSGYGQPLWLEVLGFYFQPSELLKLLLVIYLAAYMADRRDMLQFAAGARPLWPVVLGPMLTMFGLALLLLLWQQDLGAAMLFYLTFLALLYLAWGRVRYGAIGLLLCLPLALVGYWVSARVALRVSIWLNPWAPEEADRAFQILQSLFALAAGGVGGQGIGQGVPTYIPAVHTDFVYAALVEETGLIGAVGLILLLALLGYRGFRLAQRVKSPFETLLAGGITALLLLQSWVILAGNVKLIPITGVTLPFLSYGGSSLVMLLAAMGILLNLSAPHPAPLTLLLPTAPLPDMEQTTRRLARLLLLLLCTPLLSTGFWAVLRADALSTYPGNPRYVLAEARIQRGRILDRNGEPLAAILTDAEGFVERTYPVPEVAPVVGYTTLEYGAAGIEATCAPRLRGDLERNRWDALLHRPPQGHDVRLTLDARLQRAAQQALAGQPGAAVLVDTRTGDILALASAPIYTSTGVAAAWSVLRDDPAAPLLNRATQSLMQPGGILQTVVLAAALESGAPFTPGVTFAVPVTFDDVTLTCAHAPLSGEWPALLSAGCPAPFAALGESLGATQMGTLLARWGLTEAPLAEMQTAAADWPTGVVDMARAALGQGEWLVTPLQMVTVAAVIGNRGVRAPLHVLEAPLPGCVAPFTATATPVLSEETAAQLRAWWPRFGAAVGHQGTALAGPERTLEWFIGLNSAQAPRYAVAVVLETAPHGSASQRVTRESASQIGVALLLQAINPE